MKICKQCKTQNEDFNNFCMACGTPLEKSPPATPQPMQPMQPQQPQQPMQPQQPQQPQQPMQPQQPTQPQQPMYYTASQSQFTPPMQTPYQPMQNIDVLAIIKQLALSPLYITMAVLISCSTFLVILQQLLVVFETSSASGIVAFSTFGGTLFGLIPNILLIIAAWLFYSNSRDPFNRSTTALSLVKAHVIILLVLLGIVALCVPLLLLVNIFAGGTTIIFILMLILVAILSVPIIYYIVSLTAIKSLRLAVTTGQFFVNGVGALVGFSYVFGVLTILSSLFGFIPVGTSEVDQLLSQYTGIDVTTNTILTTGLTSLSSLAMGISQILMGVLLNRYKKAVKPY